MTTRQTSTPSQVRDSSGVVSTRQACVSLALCPSLLTGRHFCPHVFLSFLSTRTYLRATCLPVEYSVSSAKGLLIMPPAPPRLNYSCLPCYSSLHWRISLTPFMLGILAVPGDGSECSLCVLGPVWYSSYAEPGLWTLSMKNKALEPSFSI